MAMSMTPKHNDEGNSKKGISNEGSDNASPTFVNNKSLALRPTPALPESTNHVPLPVKPLF
jgi:hypothetical protein